MTGACDALGAVVATAAVVGNGEAVIGDVGSGGASTTGAAEADPSPLVVDGWFGRSKSVAVAGETAAAAALCCDGPSPSCFDTAKLMSSTAPTTPTAIDTPRPAATR